MFLSFPLIIANIDIRVLLHFDELIDRLPVGRFFPEHKIRPSTLQRLKPICEIPVLNCLLDYILADLIEMLHLALLN